LPTLYEPHEHKGARWGMAIDLSACVGCGACVIGCQAENNVPVVGPEQIAKGRGMHWIRVDRYYDGEPGDLQVVHEPMLCQHCDDAPCETVCPVNATTHAADGINQMAYNRCVGTRYCANNCPYKVRRFNFLDFTGETPESLQLAFNPEVTVRPRGVMEKCTFCVQRIRNAEQVAKRESRGLRERDVVTACQSACPASAIVFGDLNDPKSEAAKLSRSNRGYRVLEELGTKPAITYLASLSNPSGRGTR
jgi:molybdopterin-containing oxidoreductase family iron-sulfur binding subunit